MRIERAGWNDQYVPEPLFFYRLHDGDMSGIRQGAHAVDDDSGRKVRLLSGYWIIAETDQNLVD